jgi:hypothetical protein
MDLAFPLAIQAHWSLMGIRIPINDQWAWIAKGKAKSIERRDSFRPAEITKGDWAGADVG